MNFNERKKQKLIAACAVSGITGCALVVYANFSLTNVNWKEVFFCFLMIVFTVMLWRTIRAKG